MDLGKPLGRYWLFSKDLKWDGSYEQTMWTRFGTLLVDSLWNSLGNTLREWIHGTR